MRLKAEDLIRKLGIEVDDIDPTATDGLIRRSAAVEIKSIDEKARSVRVCASSEAIDSYDEIVVQDWDLSRYELNPTVLYLHNAGGGFCGPQTKETLPVGYATDVEIVEGKLYATLNFVDDRASPLAEFCWQGFVQKSLRAVSVGFCPSDVKPGKVDGKDVYFLSGNRLFEISVVPIGANPEAVALSHQRNVALLKARVAKTKTAQPAMPGREKTTMTEEEIKKLQAELASAKSAVAARDSEVDALKSAVAAKDAEIANLKKLALEAVAEHKTETDAKDVSIKAATERAEKAESKEIELVIDSYVGKKITPAEKDDEIELAKTIGLEKVKARLEKRADMKLGEDVTGPDQKPQNTTSDKGGASARLSAAAKK